MSKPRMCDKLKAARQQRQRVRYYLRRKRLYPSHLQKTKKTDPKGKGHRYKHNYEKPGYCKVCGQPR